MHCKNSATVQKIGVGLHRHPLVCLMDETRRTLPEEHRCALRLVQGGPEWTWIFGKPTLFETT